MSNPPTFSIKFDRLPDAIKSLSIGQYFTLDAKIVGRIIGLHFYADKSACLKLEEVQT